MLRLVLLDFPCQRWAVDSASCGMLRFFAKSVRCPATIKAAAAIRLLQPSVSALDPVIKGRDSIAGTALRVLRTIESRPLFQRPRPAVHGFRAQRARRPSARQKGPTRARQAAVPGHLATLSPRHKKGQRPASSASPFAERHRRCGRPAPRSARPDALRTTRRPASATVRSGSRRPFLRLSNQLLRLKDEYLLS